MPTLARRVVPGHESVCRMATGR